MPRTNRAARTVSLLATITFYLVAATGVTVLAAIPAIKMFSTDPTLTMDVPVSITGIDTRVLSKWSPSPLEVTELRGKLEVPITAAPVWYVVLTWIAVAVLMGLTVAFLYHMRRFFVRVRDGAPFDPINALRLRWMGWLLVALFAVKTIVASVLSGVMVAASVDAELGTARDVDWSSLFTALVLLTLAEVFRRGAALEDEQSLVV